mgnify:CR=1 FL=1
MSEQYLKIMDMEEALHLAVTDQLYLLSENGSGMNKLSYGDDTSYNPNEVLKLLLEHFRANRLYKKVN